MRRFQLNKDTPHLQTMNIIKQIGNFKKTRKADRQINSWKYDLQIFKDENSKIPEDYPGPIFERKTTRRMMSSEFRKKRGAGLIEKWA